VGQGPAAGPVRDARRQAHRRDLVRAADDLPQLLVKYLFTSEKLSVQVHPSDSQTLAAGLGRQGKEECWLVIDAEPGATLGVGFKEQVDAEAMRAAALDGSIEDMLVWHPVSAGTSSTSRRTPCTRSAAAARSSRSSRTRTSPTASTTTAARASCTSTRRSRWPRGAARARH
jgi:hypothetical protein